MQNLNLTDIIEIIKQVGVVIGGLVLLVGAIAQAIVTVKNSGKIEAITQRQDSQAEGIRRNRSDITAVALAVPGATVTTAGTVDAAGTTDAATAPAADTQDTEKAG